MVLQNIDYNLPTPPSRSNEPINPASNRQIQAPTPLMASTNPTHSQTHQQQTTWHIILRLTFETSEIVTRFQLTMLDGVHFILEPIPESNTVIPHRARLNETWTQREYELILEPNRQRIPRGILLNEPWTLREHEIPEQVQNQVDDFFRQLQPPTYSAAYPMSRNQNILVRESASNSMPITVNQTLQLLTPVPMNVPFPLVSPYGEASSSSYEPQNQMGGATASPSMNANADADEEIDLELRLGRSQ